MISPSGMSPGRAQSPYWVDGIRLNEHWKKEGGAPPFCVEGNFKAVLFFDVLKKVVYAHSMSETKDIYQQNLIGVLTFGFLYVIMKIE